MKLGRFVSIGSELSSAKAGGADKQTISTIIKLANNLRDIAEL
jgi:hypothetical protein